LDKDSRRLDYHVYCDWQERGKPGENIPQLNFYAPVSYRCAGYKYDVPFGTVHREPMDMDAPGNSFIVGCREDGAGSQLMLVTDSKYGFRGYDDALAVSLIRGSYDPDRYPDIGFHEIRLALCVAPAAASKQGLIQQAYDFNHPLTVISSRPQESGNWPLAHAFIQLEAGTVAVSAVKMPEEAKGKEMLIRLYETEGQDTTVKLAFCRYIQEASLVDINEQPLADAPKPEVEGGKVAFPVGAGSIANIKLVFA